MDSINIEDYYFGLSVHVKKLVNKSEMIVG